MSAVVPPALLAPADKLAQLAVLFAAAHESAFGTKGHIEMSGAAIHWLV